MSLRMRHFTHDGFDWIEYDCESNNCSHNIEPIADELWVRGALNGEAIESYYTVIYNECGLANESHNLILQAKVSVPTTMIFQD